MNSGGTLLLFWVLLALTAVPSLAAQDSTSAKTAATPSESSSVSDGPPKDFSEKYQLRVVTNEAPTTVVTGKVTNVETKSFHWDFSWKGWNGLEIGFSQRTPLKTPREMLGLPPLSSNAPALHLEQLKMSATLGATLEVDGAAYDTTGNLDLKDDIQLRRARLKAQGDCIVLLPVGHGPFTVQGEFIDSLVHQNNGDNLNFWGFYASAGWYLTGESRPYDRENGYFARLVPRRNFDFGKGGAWGAFQLSARFSYTDLDNGDIHGGSIGLAMAELNWYLHSHVRWMFNAGGGHVTGGPSDGNIVLFQTRIGVDF